MTSIKHNCKDELKEASLRATPTRLAVLGLLEKADKPIDTATIIEYLKQNNIKTDPATIFRIMNSFTDKGITKQIQLFEGKFRYEHASIKDHHHLVCEKCGNIQDISDCSIGALEEEIKQKKSFMVKNHSLEFFGLCKQCQH